MYLQIKKEQICQNAQILLYWNFILLTLLIQLRFATSAKSRKKFLAPPPLDQILDPLLDFLLQKIFFSPRYKFAIFTFAIIYHIPICTNLICAFPVLTERKESVNRIILYTEKYVQWC